jgi:hypothetical protein
MMGVAVRAGVRVRAASSVADARARLTADLAWLPREALDIRAPQAPRAVASDELLRLATRVDESYAVDAD